MIGPEETLNPEAAPSTAEQNGLDAPLADSSAADQGEGLSLEDHLNAEIFGDEDGGEGEGEGSEGTPASENNGEVAEGEKKVEGEGEAELSDEEKEAAADAKVPFHDHPRWKEVLGERNALRDENEAMKTENAELKVKAERIDAIDNYMTTTGISQQEMAEGYEIMAAMKRGDANAAMRMLAPHLQQMQRITGDILPPDLEQAVQRGEITKARAKDVAAQRVSLNMQRDSLNAERARAEEDKVRSHFAACETAVNNWEADKTRTDPDFQAIAQEVREHFALSVQANMPKTIEDAIKLADASLATVKARYAKRLPPKQPVKVIPEGNGVQTTPKAPKSLADVVDGVLGE